MWYAVQTITGNEEEAAKEIRKTVDADIYEECFLLKREAVWRIQGSCRVHVERLFPGYVFISTQYPKELYHGIHHYNKILDSYREMAVPRGRHI